MASVTGLGNTQSLHAAQGIKGITAVSAPVVKTVAAPQTHVPTEVGVKTPPPPAPRPEISSQSLADSTVGHLRTGGKATWALDDLGVGKDTREVTLGGVNFSATEMRELTS